MELREPTVQEKAAEVGLSMARLARESHVNYHRIQHGYALMGDEESRIEAVIDKYQYRRRMHPDRAVV